MNRNRKYSVTPSQLPAMPPDFSHSIECRGRDLASVIEQAKEQGYHTHRMTVLPDVIYELRFWRCNHNATKTQPVTAV